MSLKETERCFRYQITKNMELVSEDELVVKERSGGPTLVFLDHDRPLLVLCTWLGAKSKHINKFVEFYIDKGFDVLVARTPGIMSLTHEYHHLADFLLEHGRFQPLLIHTLSIGSLTWSLSKDNMLNKTKRDLKTLERVKGEIWDSAPITDDISRSFSYVLVGHEGILQVLMHLLFWLYFHVTYHFTLKYYNAARYLLENPVNEVPALMFISKDDHISLFDENMKLMERWKSLGIQGTVKWWEKSEHVCHFRFYKEEYSEQLQSFICSIGLGDLKNNKKIR